MKKRETVSTPSNTALVRMTSWRGMQPHDAIRVTGKPGQRSRFEFLAFVQNVATGECFVEVVGGRLSRNGTFQRNVRMFAPERCSPPPRRRARRRPSTIEVTQLSFDDLLDPQLHEFPDAIT